VAAGIIPRDQEEVDQKGKETQSKTDVMPPSETFEESLSQEISIRVEGMWCVACSLLVEEFLRKMKGVLQAQVLFLADLAVIRYLPHLVKPLEILNRISSLGYGASLFQEERDRLEEKKTLVLRLGLSAILTMNIMMISFSLYFGFFQDLGEQAIGYLSYPLFLMATPVLFYGGFPILKRAYLGFRHHHASMDTLIAIGSLSAYGYSLLQMSKGSIHLYFDTAAMLITLVLLGRYLEMGAKEKVTKGITELYTFSKQKVRLVAKGAERWVSLEALEKGEEFLVKEGERIPADASILLGQAVLDESFLTGESRPSKKCAGEEVMAGALLLKGDLLLKANSAGREGSIARMITIMQEALMKKNPVELLADRITRRFVPSVLFLAAVTVPALLLQGSSAHESILRGLTVLVIACPCALGIATPLAKVASIGSGKARGILIRDSAVFEKAKNLDMIILDKTGTVTEGCFSLLEIISLDGMSEKEALMQAAAVEAHSDHLLAKEILRRAVSLLGGWEEATHFESFEGLGVRGIVQGKEVLLGSRRFIDRCRVGIGDEIARCAEALESRGLTVVFFASDGKPRALFPFGDILKETARETVTALQSRGLETWLVSGDSEKTTQAIAEELKVDGFAGQTLPQGKVEAIVSFQRSGRRVGMVGDGLNDAAALAQADVGFALGTKSGILQEASGITIVGGDPRKVPEALQLSFLTGRIVRQNLFFSFFYNLLGIPLALSGILNPIIAVLAMVASSLTVVGNTLRISRQNRF
jgi:heavy metal translocating P-type ATPase